jgi:hypothetical protein
MRPSPLSFVSIFCYHDFMKKARIFDNKKSGRGRPRTGIGTLIGLRWHEPELKAIDEWRSRQEDLPSRSESIRRLVQQALRKRRQ